jgi:DNA-binding transcriptional regulator YiaG
LLRAIRTSIAVLLQVEIVLQLAYNSAHSMQTVASKGFTSSKNYRTRREMAPERVRKIMSELKDYADRYSIKQRQIAQMLGIKPQQLNDWLQGRREPTAERMLEILELLKRKPDTPSKQRKSKGARATKPRQDA